MLQMDFHVFGERFAIIAHDWLPIFAHYHNGLCSGNAPFLVPTDLE
jgi:hypothetical protein